jgi:hypothetical protein
MIGQLPAFQQPVVRADVQDRSAADLLESIGTLLFGDDQPRPSAIRNAAQESL